MGAGDRSIVVRIRSDVGQAISGVKATSAAVKDFGVQSLASADRNAKSWDRVGKASLIAGGAIALALGVAIHQAAEFDSAMSVVAANIDDKSVPSLNRLRAAALHAGTTTAFSARDAAEAENELAKAGLTSAQITGGALTAALNLASAGQIGLADSAAIVSSTMVQFNLKASDAVHISDLLAAGADKALGGVQDLGEAMKYTAVPASQLGISLEQTTGTLALFASNGILGSMAGTGLRQILVSLTAPTKDASAAMEKYGINVFDAQGNFVGLSNVAGQLHDKLGPLTDAQRSAALATIFTSRSIGEANILMQAGAKGVDDWTNKVNDQGFAAEQARRKLDNLNGDLLKLKNTFGVALIETGEEAQGTLRGLAQEATGLIDVYNQLSPTAKGVVVTTASIVAGLALLSGGLLIAVPKVVAFNSALKAVTGAETFLGSLGKISRFMVGPWGLAFAAGSIALGLFVKHHIDAARAAAELTAALEADSGAVGANTRAYVVNALAQAGILDQAKRVGLTLSDVTDAALGNADAQHRLAGQVSNLKTNLAGMVAQNTIAGHSAYEQAQAADKVYDAVTGQSGAISDASKAAKLHAEAMGTDSAAQDAAAASGHQLTHSFVEIGDSAHDSTFDVTGFTQSLTDWYDQAFGLIDAQDKVTLGWRDLSKQVRHTTGATDGNSTAAINNRTKLHEQAKALSDVIAQYAAHNHTAPQVEAFAKTIADNFANDAKKAGLHGAAVKDVVRQLRDIPANVVSNVTINTKVAGVSSAARQLGYLQGLVNKLNASDLPNAGKGGPHSAFGQRYWPGGGTWVGEKGAEWVNLPRGSEVYPHGMMPADSTKFAPQLAQTGGGGGLTLNVTVTAPPKTSNPVAWGERMGQGARRSLAMAGIGA
jgi:TP901 family phage tail tape measure protein